VAMAALMHEKTGVEGRRTVAVLSGGNVDPALLARWLAEE
jgi:threonine dehydratase